MILEDRIHQYNIQNLTINYFFNRQITYNRLINPYNFGIVYDIPLGNNRWLRVDDLLINRIEDSRDVWRIYNTIRDI